jgi:hypothetical protein
VTKLSDTERVGTDGQGHGAKYVHGSYPICSMRGPVTGLWFCTSPYIEDPAVDAPDDGGPPVILKGQEPGRFGR